MSALRHLLYRCILRRWIITVEIRAEHARRHSRILHVYNTWAHVFSCHHSCALCDVQSQLARDAASSSQSRGRIVTAPCIEGIDSEIIAIVVTVRYICAFLVVFLESINPAAITSGPDIAASALSASAVGRLLVVIVIICTSPTSSSSSGGGDRE